MTKDFLSEKLIGMFAYDSGSVDSGIHDPEAKRLCIEYLDSLGGKEYRAVLARIAREAFLSEDAIGEGYGIEDVAKFNEWLEYWR
jgi:hypothetical protein